jgi:methionyl-tRNA formyltransferase
VRILFFGLPLGALTLAHAGHTITRAIICRKACLGLRRIRRVLGPERVLVKPQLDAARLRDLAGDAPELVVSWFWTEKLPREVIALAPLGGLGVHPSLLPRHRGPDPYYWTILRGDTVTGVTAHLLDAEYDTGAMLGKRELAVDPHWNAWTLAKKLDRPSLHLLREVVATRRNLVPEAQDEALHTLAPSPTEDTLELNVHDSAESVLAQIRAAAPFPGAYFYVGDSATAVLYGHVTDRFPAALAPGECALHDGQVVLRCGSGALALTAVRDESTDQTVTDPARIAALLGARH